MTTDILCPVCQHSINRHGANGCYKIKLPEDKTPGTYCPCKQSAAEIARYEVEKVEREHDKQIAEIRSEYESQKRE